MLILELTHSLHYTMRCYQELRRDALSLLSSIESSNPLAATRFSLFSSRRRFRKDELGLGLPAFEGYAFGIN
jgi:hypothetical protein